MSANRALALLLGVAFAGLLLVNATGGPDCLEYLAWSHAAEKGEIGQIKSEMRSPLGIPLTQWSHGPGLFYALPYMTPGLGAVVPDGPLAPARDFRLIGWLAALVLWGGLIGLLRRLTGGDLTLTLFIATAAFAGTHLGFYSFHHSSEVLSLGCFALIVYLLWRDPLPGRLELAGISAALGCLVLIRPHLVVYLPLLVGYLTWRFWRRSGSGAGRLMVHGALLGAGPLLALAQIAWVNRWMTGSFSDSAYAFGDGAFRSLDFARPELLAVALHPWHGLLVYHPLYGLAFVMLAIGIFCGTRSQRLLYLGVAVTLLVHFYIQAAWHCWWLGLWSLGNRGLSPAALLLLPVLAHGMKAARPRGRLALAGGVLLCSLWSLLLMVQGHTNFYRWSELLSAQGEAAVHLAPVLPLVLVAALITYLLARGRVPSLRWLATGTALLAALILDHLVMLILETAQGADGGWGIILLRLGGLALAPAVALLNLPPRTKRPKTRPLLAAVVLLLFLGVSALFLRLAIRTESAIAAGGLRGSGPVATYQIPEVMECYWEYLEVPGFEDKKAAMRSFLTRESAETEPR